jgi:glycolate oxidase FAD binding subunit
VTAPVSIAGVTPARELVPADRRQLASMVRELAEGRRSFAFVGGGTDLDFGNAPRALDAVIRTTSLSRVIEYAPEDQTITVEGGARIADIDAVLAEAGQLLPIDVGDRKYATIGGAIATNAFGARRHRYGSIKDAIVGVEIVRPDGVVARGGGKVVKNVAGFDLPKLMVGSLGTLGAIVSATLRVFPRPHAWRAIALDAAPDAPAVGAVLGDRALEPVAVTSSAERGTIVEFAGLSSAVDAQVERAAAIAAAHGVFVQQLDAQALDLAHASERDIRSRGAWRATVAHAPAAPAVPCIPAAARALAYPTLGITIASSDDEPFDAEAVERARASGTVVFHAMPNRARAGLDAWGPPPPAFPVMRELKARFDPHGICNPGRFIGGL